MIEHVVSQQSANTGASSLTFAIDVGSGNNRLLLVGVMNEHTNGSNANLPVTGITFDGVAMTKIDADSMVGGSDTDRSELWYLLNPNSGSHNVVITCTGAVGGLIGIASAYTGVKQQAYEVTNKAKADSAGPCVTAVTPLTSNALVYGVGCNGSAGNTFTTGTGQERGNTSAGGIIDGATADTIISGAPVSTSISFTLGGSSRWVSITASFAPHVDAGGGALLLMAS